MSLYEFIVRLTNATQPIVWPVLITAILTIVAFIVADILANKTWVDDKSFKWIGIFYSLNTKGAIRLACAWVKFCLLLVFIIQFKKLQTVSYILLVICGLVSAFTFRSVFRLITNILGLAVEIAGLFAVNSVCGYIIDMFGGTFYIALYVVSGILLAAYGFYIFLIELQDISEEREAILDEE